MSDPYTSYETSMQRLLDHLGREHPRYAEALIYQQRLLENIAFARQHGDTEQRRAERADIIAQINALARATGGPVMTADPGPAADLPDGRWFAGSPRDRDNRRRMLEQVRRFWVEGVLEQSLYQEVLLDLHLETNPQAISFVGPRLLAQTDREPQPLPPGTTIAQVYQDAHQRLLILGQPGAGKTTLLLDLARTLLDQAERDERCPLPVVFNLSSWAQQRLPLERWLVQELRDQYGVSRRLAQQWVRANAILPLLDGLDEVAAPQRAGCVQAINTFCREHGTEGIVVCSRVADYAAIGERLALDAAVLLQPLDDAQIDHYLAWVGQPLAGVQAVLAQDADLRDLVRTPLLLNIVTLAYQHQRPEELVGLPPEAQRRHLFDSYVQHMFARRARHDPQRYPQAQTLRWLRWLAGRLAQENQTVFQLELMQPWWLRRWWQRGLYVLLSTLFAGTGGALLGVVFGLLFGLLFGLGLEALIWGFPSAIDAADLSGLSVQGDGLVVGLRGGLRSGPGFGLVVGLVVGLGGGLFQRIPARQRAWHAATGGLLAAGLAYGPWAALGLGGVNGIWFWGFSSIPLGLATGALIRQGTIRPTETLRWSWRTLRARWYLVLVVGLGFGLGFGLVVGLAVGLVVGLGFGLVVGLVVGLTQTELQTKTRPNQGIWRSLQRALVSWSGIGLVGGMSFGMSFGLSFGMSFGLSFGVKFGFGFGMSVVLIFGLLFGMVFGPVAGFYFGGLAFVQHFALRLVCALCGDAPWNYPRFLDYAVDRILLRRVGGSYIFVHRMLLDYFAEEEEAQV